MDEVTPAVIAIAFGLSAVFIPVAFISGITGQFYRQFALTISFSTLLSAFNSLTLSPALAALLLKPHGAKQDWLTRGHRTSSLGWFFRLFNRGFDATNRRLHPRCCARSCGSAPSPCSSMRASSCWRISDSKPCPPGSFPPQDQGYLIVNVQMPDAASIDRTQATHGAAREDRHQDTGRAGPLHRRGLVHPRERELLRRGRHVLHRWSRSANARGIPSCPQARSPASCSAQFSQDAGSASSWSSRRRRCAASATRAASRCRSRIAPGRTRRSSCRPSSTSSSPKRRKRPELVPGSSPASAPSFPQFYGNVDRVKAKQQNVAVTDVFQALQVYLGGLYINDFNYLGRTWHVTAQADAPVPRQRRRPSARFETRNAAGQMVPLGAVMDLKDITGPDRIQRYDLYHVRRDQRQHRARLQQRPGASPPWRRWRARSCPRSTA